MSKTVVCPNCFGAKVIVEDIGFNPISYNCEVCGGTGEVSEEKEQIYLDKLQQDLAKMRNENEDI